MGVVVLPSLSIVVGGVDSTSGPLPEKVMSSCELMVSLVGVVMGMPLRGVVVTSTGAMETTARIEIPKKSAPPALGLIPLRVHQTCPTVDPFGSGHMPVQSGPPHTLTVVPLTNPIPTPFGHTLTYGPPHPPCRTYKGLTVFPLVLGGTHAHTDVLARAIIQAAGVTGALKQEGQGDLHCEFSCPVPQDSTIRALIFQTSSRDHQTAIFGDVMSKNGCSD